jgi:16S rRNA (uracil1498-N3)-methyltransferase
MIIFYSKNITNNVALLIEDEARHCAKVLRKRVGEQVRFTDGLGYFYNGEITNISKNECELSILNKWKGEELNYKLTIAISLVKNQSRFEWFLEKAVEIGVDRIIPIICKRTEKRNIKEKRLENILISASKQSLKAKFPILESPILFNDLIEDNNDSIFIAHLNDDAVYLGKAIKPKESYTILIGPEGDFTEEELKIAFNNGIKPVTLGTSRLRTETAGIVACQIINTINELE